MGSSVLTASKNLEDSGIFKILDFATPFRAYAWRSDNAKSAFLQQFFADDQGKRFETERFLYGFRDLWHFQNDFEKFCFRNLRRGLEAKNRFF
jgi:hypothetical protein